jgi:D-alanyl-D-alanine carboxypeptidase
VRTARTATIAMVAVVGLVAASCGGDDDSASGGATTGAGSAAPATTSEATEAEATTTEAEATTTEAAADTTSETTEAAPSSSAAAGEFTAEEIAQIDAAAMASLTNGTTGTIVSVVDPERGTFLKAYGTADTAGTPLTPEMHYRIASVSKTFTAEAVLRLVDQGLVALSDPISMYVDDLPNGDVVTVQDLLAMRSGLFDFANDQDFFNQYLADPTMPWSTEDTLAIIRANPPVSAPNQETVYNNGSYVILGEVIERVTGQTVDEHLTQLIGELGLPNTTYPTGDTLPEPYVTGYYSDGQMAPPEGGYRDDTLSNPVVPGAAGAIVSTVPDITKYAIAMGTGEGLTPETFETRQTWSPLTTSGVRLQYGLGITQLGDWIGHDGSIFGYSNMVWYLPSEQAAVVVMNNAADEIAVPSQALWGEVVNVLYPDTLTTW